MEGLIGKDSDVNVTSATSSEEQKQYVYGLPGYVFYLIHITAIVSASTSILSSSTVLVYLNYPFKINFYTRSIGMLFDTKTYLINY